MKYYLAIDIGASSGRHILCHMEDGRMVLEEIHRFPNGMVPINGHKCWEADRLFDEIVAGMKKAADLGKIPESVGIDTWAVDYVLLDSEDKRIGEAIGYRDSRTDGMDEEVYKIIPEDELYGRAGIQKQMFNTIYQLMADKVAADGRLDEAETMLMVPDYFHYLLSGVKATEYTNATTGQLVSPDTKDWDWELIDRLGYPRKIFQKIVTPGTDLGPLTDEIAAKVGYQCHVVVPATHDTGSAVMAVPTNAEDTLYISSGTWSLMGTEIKEAICTPDSKKANLTNEGGYDYRFRYLKNIMGLWMIQSVKKEIAQDKGFGEICELASQQTIPSIVPANDDRFLAPENMTEEVKKCCAESGQPVPETLGEVASVIYNSLAKCYGDTIDEIETMTGKKFDRVNIVGGGANAGYLNELTAKATKRPVYAGPTEGTAIGNLMAQMITAGEFASLQEARTCVFNSFEIKTYQP